LLDSTELRKKVKELAVILKDEKSLLCIGKGMGLQTAREAALKLKEVCYIHAEAIGSGDLKHGPISLIDPINKKKFKIILFIFDDNRFDQMCLSLDQVDAREAYTIVITDCYERLDHKKIDFHIQVQSVNYLGAMLAIIPIQLLCLYLSEMLNLTPDKPRNLAKTVTVN
jgi:glutamine---fructose-6-phosphate transaminase (isomerizing)